MTAMEGPAPYVSLGLKHHDACLAHGPAAPRDCWRGLYGNAVIDATYIDEPMGDTDVNDLLYDFVMCLRPDQQARVVCAWGALIDGDMPADEALRQVLLWERGPQ